MAGHEDRSKQLANQASSPQAIGVALGASAQLIGSLLSDKQRLTQRQKAGDRQVVQREQESDELRKQDQKEISRGALQRLMQSFGKEVTKR